MNLYVIGAKILAGLALLAAVVWGCHLIMEHYRDQGRAEVQTKWDADIERRREQVSAITLAWNQQRIAADAAGKDRDDERSKRLTEATKHARAIPAAIAAVVVPAVALSVLDDAIRDSATAPGSGAPSVADAPGPSTPAPNAADGTVGALIEWGVLAIDRYNGCRDLLTGWQKFYAGLVAAQPAEVAP